MILLLALTFSLLSVQAKFASGFTSITYLLSELSSNPISPGKRDKNPNKNTRGTNWIMFFFILA